MALLKDGRPAEDRWTVVADDAPVPANGAVIVGLARWQAERDALAVRNAPLGVRLGSADPAESVVTDLARVALVAVEFPKFRDGRGFSTARELRERYGYTGEIRAVGHVIPDQYLYLVRTGFSSVEAPEGTNPDSWTNALTEVTIAFQPSLDDTAPLSLLRRKLKVG